MSDNFELNHGGYSDGRHVGMEMYYWQNVGRAHGGYIQVKSSIAPENHGTTFILCIPVGRTISAETETDENGTDH